MLGEEVFANPLQPETSEVEISLNDEKEDVDETFRTARTNITGDTLQNEGAEPPVVEDTSSSSNVAAEETYSSLIENRNVRHRTEEINIDMDSADSIFVDISDALSERDKVKYTVHTRTRLQDMRPETAVVREHEEFLWLHGTLEENEAYAGFIIPPAPPKPNFDSSREKLQKLGEGEATMTKEEFLKMKHDLEQDYLAQFKKTVAMHEVFLQRVAAHPVFKNDQNFRIFLQYENELSVRGKNKKEQVESFWKRFTQSADEVLLSGQKDVDEFFEKEKNYMVEYNIHIKEAAAKAEKLNAARKKSESKISDVVVSFSKIGDCFERIARGEPNKQLARTFAQGADAMMKLKKVESRASNDEELKLSDTLNYFTRDTQAAKDLLYRRMRCLANYEAANKNLERARAKNREIQKAEAEQAEACKKFEEITGLAKTELKDLKVRRVQAFKKNLIDLAELEKKHTKAEISLLEDVVNRLKHMP
ncbi:CRE-SNX-6 protein [Caenorhabditis remanei]|uniref:CRE-SNX-6 protein n=1 Tax=Caenorhabditis remanei TaxID=31234 RepID=E3MF94_CAERE|nr:CRE-SNX-6 protein [Caenorhabditis remanei]